MSAINESTALAPLHEASADRVLYECLNVSVQPLPVRLSAPVLIEVTAGVPVTRSKAIAPAAFGVMPSSVAPWIETFPKFGIGKQGQVTAVGLFGTLPIPSNTSTGTPTIVVLFALTVFNWVTSFTVALTPAEDPDELSLMVSPALGAQVVAGVSFPLRNTAAEYDTPGGEGEAALQAIRTIATAAPVVVGEEAVATNVIAIVSLVGVTPVVHPVTAGTLNVSDADAEAGTELTTAYPACVVLAVFAFPRCDACAE
jgi:hypothetical protein